MSREKVDRVALLQALHTASRRLTNQSGLYTDAVADRLGLNRTDLDALSIVHLEDGATAGRLAEITGLTTGAVTGVIDRLEKHGFVRREADPDDRRRVVVRAVAERGREVGALFDPLQEALDRLYNRYSDADLATLLDLADRSLPVVQEQTARLRGTGAAGGEQIVQFAAPLGGYRQATLEFVRGAGRVDVRADAALTELYRARFDRNVAAVTEHDGTVQVRYRRSPLSWRSGAAEIVLNGNTAWELVFKGGASHVNADLRAAMVTGVQLAGGLSHAELWLPAPQGLVAVTLAGGANGLTIHRPTAVPVRVNVKGGVSNLRLDEQRFGAVGGNVTLDSSGYAGQPDRYEISIRGGASTLTIDGA
jgi:DNA-binding MarR family transcriptional regulator